MGEDCGRLPAGRSGAHTRTPCAPPRADKLAGLGTLLGLSPEGDRAALLAVVSAAPNLLQRGSEALALSWGALEAAYGSEGARALAAAAPHLLGYSARELEARAGALDALGRLSDSWAARVADARAPPAELAALLAARAPAHARLAWLVDSRQTLAPVGVPMRELLHMERAAFEDIYPQWREAGDAALAARARGGGGAPGTV